jgi:replicative DNA helicase
LVVLVTGATHEWLTTSEKARRSALMNKKKRGDRKWLKPRGSDQRYKRTFPSVVTTEQIAATLMSQGKHNHQVALAGALQQPPAVLPVEPYTLGTWLGDGHSWHGALTCFDQPIIEELAAVGDVARPQRATVGVFTILGLQPKLRRLGVLRNKHIPKAYLSASIEQRKALLRGLMDTDGHCAKDRRCEFCSTNEGLANDVLELVLGLGLKATMISGDATIDGRFISKKYRLCFVADFPAFTLARKISAQRIGDYIKPSRKCRTIVACDPVPSVPTRCIQVDSPSHLYLAGRSLVPTHNSVLVTQIAVEVAKLHGWNSLIFSPEMPVVPQYRERLRRVIGGGNANADAFVEQHIRFIDHPPTAVDDGDIDVDEIIRRAAEAVMRDDIRLVIVDPWNEIEHSKDPGENISDYCGR